MINIISLDFPGEKAESKSRYQRSRKIIEILRRAWSQGRINYNG